MQRSGSKYWTLFGISMVLLACQALLKHCSQVDLPEPPPTRSASRIQPDPALSPSKEGRPVPRAAVPAPPPGPATPAVLEAAFDTCRIEDFVMPEDARVFAAGAYGGKETDFQIDQSGSPATTLEVAVNKPGAPVVLLLGAYEPTVWSVRWTKGTRIAAVLLTGYHHQQITGLSPDVPLLVSTYDNKGPCGYAYIGGEGAARLNPLARDVFGRPVDTAYAATDGRIEIGRVPPGTALSTDPGARPPAALKLKDLPPAGDAGIEAALRARIIRPATPADVKAWNAARERVNGGPDTPRIVGERASAPGVPYRSYTVLKDFAIPAGLYGAHAATFFVAKGVPPPTGNPGHSSVHFIDDGSCSGVTCGMR